MATLASDRAPPPGPHEHDGATGPLVSEHSPATGRERPAKPEEAGAPGQAVRRHYWPALHFVDTDGVIRDHHVGEGRYEQSERAIQRLLGVERELVCVEGLGVLIGVLGFPP